MKNFGSQVVIAIENARLLNELSTARWSSRRRRRRCFRSLARHWAICEPVFASILANATRICEADFGVLVLV